MALKRTEFNTTVTILFENKTNVEAHADAMALIVK